MVHLNPAYSFVPARKGAVHPTHDSSNHAKAGRNSLHPHGGRELSRTKKPRTKPMVSFYEVTKDPDQKLPLATRLYDFPDTRSAHDEPWQASISQRWRRS